MYCTTYVIRETSDLPPDKKYNIRFFIQHCVLWSHTTKQQLLCVAHQHDYLYMLARATVDIIATEWGTRCLPKAYYQNWLQSQKRDLFAIFGVLVD